MPMPPKQRTTYTLRFKVDAVHMVSDTCSAAAVARELQIPDQTLHNWLKADREGRLPKLIDFAPKGGVARELKRLRGELAQVTMERDLLKTQLASLVEPTWRGLVMGGPTRAKAGGAGGSPRSKPAAATASKRSKPASASSA